MKIDYSKYRLIRDRLYDYPQTHPFKNLYQYKVFIKPFTEPMASHIFIGNISECMYFLKAVEFGLIELK